MRLFNQKCVLLFLFAVLLFFVGCAKRHVAEFSSSLSGSVFNETKLESDRMFIWYAHLTLEVDKTDGILEQVTYIVEQSDGYIAKGIGWVVKKMFIIN